MTTCESCGAAGQPDGAKFCFSCGAPLQAPTCVGCGAGILAGARFCSECGVAQPGAVAPVVVQQPVASRRITSVLFGDLVGFTTLSESRDQEQVRELLSRYFDECRAIIARYGGTVEKFIGDAVMAVWGVPTAHEDDAERTVRAGLELVNTIEALGVDVGVPDLAMRIGIVTGEVAVTVGAEQQGMVAGDAVNTASRVQSVAPPGQVWVDETTRLLTSSAISYVDAGSHDLKGKADPVPLWAVRAVVAAVGGAQRADGLEAPLIGREREMRVVKELFHRVQETGRPALLVVDGEAGVGKTRLGWEFEKYVDGLSAQVRWHAGRCLSYGEGVAYYALAEAIRARLQVNHVNAVGAEDADPAALLAGGLDRLVPSASEREWLGPRVAALLGIGAITSFAREDLFAAWATFLQRVSEDNPDASMPVVLLVDDAQHADEGLLAFVEHLLAVGAFPCFVALLTRPGLLEANPHLATNRRATVVHLDALGPREMGELLDGLVDGLDDTLRGSLVARAEGVPLFAVETIRSLIDRDLVVPRGGRYVLADGEALDLDEIGAPASLHALVAARLDKLTPEQRRVVDQASVVGKSFARDTIAALCPEVADVDAVLASLVRLQLLRQESNRLSAEVGLYQFVQAVVLQVAYGTLSRRDRKAAHLAVVAHFMDAEQSDDQAAIGARHHIDAIDAVPEDPDVPELTARAIELLQRAATRARSLGAITDAAGHLRTAHERATEPLLRAEIELYLAQALRDIGQEAAAIPYAESARDTFDAAGDDLRAGEAVAVLGICLAIGANEHEAGMAMCEERYLALRDRDDATKVLLSLSHTIIPLQLRTGGDMRPYTEEKARLAELLGDAEALVEACTYLAIYYTISGSRAIGRTLFESAALQAREHHFGKSLARSLINLAVTWKSDDAAKAVEYNLEALEVTRQTGVVYALNACASNLAMAQVLAGDWDGALAAAPEVAEDRPIADVVVGRIAQARGTDWEPSAMTLERLGAEADSADLMLASFVNIAGILAGLVDPAEAPQLARTSAETSYRHSGLFDDFSLLWQVATEVAWAAGDRAELDRMLAIVDEHRGSAIPVGIRAQRARMAGLVAAADGDPAEAEAQLRSAMTWSEQWRSAPTLALCQGDLAAVLVQAGRAAEAAPYAEAARATFDELGAVRWSQRLDEAVATVRV